MSKTNGIKEMKLVPSQIIGTGHYTPAKILHNSELANNFNVTEEWIHSRTGIHSRYIATEEQVTSEIALYAALNAIDEANINPEEIDMIIFCTITPDKLCPSTACVLQDKLKAYNAVCFDLVAACAGFVFGLATAYQYISTGMYKTVLVVGADLLSRFTDYSNKSSSILFGDGAGAVIIRASDENSFFNFKLGSDGSLREMIYIPSSGTEKSDEKPYLTLKGKEVFKWAVNNIPDIITESVDEAGLKISEIDSFLIHQANKRISKAIMERLNISEKKFPCNISEYGNTSAASIPILLSQSVKNGKIKKGNKVLMVGFGSGMSWGTCVLEWKV